MTSLAFWESKTLTKMLTTQIACTVCEHCDILDAENKLMHLPHKCRGNKFYILRAKGLNMEKQSMERAAEKMLDYCNSVALASITEDGYPRICQMEKVLSDGLSHIYFATLKSSTKVNNFRLNPKSSVEFCIDDDSVTLIGNVHIIEDEAEKKEILPPEYMERLRKKDITRYCVLHFETLAAKVFVDGKFETYTYTK